MTRHEFILFIWISGSQNDFFKGADILVETVHVYDLSILTCIYS